MKPTVKAPRGVRAICVSGILFLAIAAGQAQVLAPEEIRDPQLRALQQKYRSELKLIANAAAARRFPYHFYFSRQLDLDEKTQQRSDQRSIQFDRYQGQLVIKVIGNYFASYSAELLKPAERARKTYENVILPLLEAAVPAFEQGDVPQAFAFEISHHVRKKVLGVTTEAAENVVLVLPKASAERLVASRDPQVQQAAVLEGEAFLNAEPISLWPHAEEKIAQAAPPQTPTQGPPPVEPPAPTASERLMKGVNLPKVSVKTAAEPPEVSSPHDSSLDAAKDLQKSYQPAIDRMVEELESQAHFVRYAPPSFIPFHNGLYLQLSVATALPQTTAGTQYRLAALAFDQHIAHLIRPVLTYFKDRRDFDGIDFSTTIRISPEADGSPLAVEFVFPLRLLNAYADFDSTGQQLIDAGYVLINGERVSLNLQTAEAGSTAP